MLRSCLFPVLVRGLCPRVVHASSKAGTLSRAPCSRQSGASIIEFSIVAVPILLVGLGSIEVAQWFFSRQAVSLALLEAGRAAITAHAQPAVIEAAFEQALLPLFPAAAGRNPRQRLQNALDQRSKTTGAAPWRIEVLSPIPQAFLDFPDASLAIGRQTGLPAINNNYLAEQDQRNRARGWNDGLGPQSGVSILQANTLVLRLTYLHEPVLPGLKGLMRQLGSEGKSYGRNAMARGGYIPLVQDMALIMQSHPLAWPSLANGKVVTRQVPASASLAPASDCQGLWCMNGPSEGSSSGAAGSNPGSGGVLPQWPPADGQGNNQAGPPAGENMPGAAGPGDLVSAPDDPACGVALCCGT